MVVRVCDIVLYVVKVVLSIVRFLKYFESRPDCIESLWWRGVGKN